MPGRGVSPNMGESDGLRMSPSSRSVLLCARRASEQARFAEHVLFPSCGIELVRRIFFSGRSRRRCRRRTANNRNASAAGLSLSETLTSRPWAGAEIFSSLNWSKIAGRSEETGSSTPAAPVRRAPFAFGDATPFDAGTWAIRGVLRSGTAFFGSGGATASHSDTARRSAWRSNSVASGTGDTLFPDRSASDLCSASNIRLILTRFKRNRHIQIGGAHYRLTQRGIQIAKDFRRSLYIHFSLGSVAFGLIEEVHVKAELSCDILYNVNGDYGNLPCVSDDERVFTHGV